MLQLGLLVNTVLLPACCLAFSWPRIGSHATGPADLDIDTNALLNDLQDASSLRMNLDALQAYSHKPDCFKKAAGLIRARCSELDMDEEARVNAAISMTLCEVATAKHYSLPLECMPYAMDSQTTGLTTSKTRGECVDSLARSAQFWSSYSGYLREVPQLCHAFRRWNDIDLARNIYYNITTEKLSLVRFMHDQQKKSARHLEEWAQRSEAIQDASNEMKLFSKLYRSTTNRLIVQLNDEINGTLAMFEVWAHNILRKKEKTEADSLIKFEASLDRTLYENAAKLQELITAIYSASSRHLDGLIAHYDVYNERLNYTVINVRRHWMELGDGFNAMKQDIAKVSERAAEASSVLSLSVSDANKIRNLQAEVSHSAVDLARTLGKLTDTAHVELDKINRSAYIIQQHLSMQNEAVGWPWTNVLIKFVEFVCRVDPTYLASVEHLAWFRLLVSAFGFGWTVFRTVFSVLMSLFLLLLLITRDIFGRKLECLFSKRIDRYLKLGKSSIDGINYTETTFIVNAWSSA